jgi:transitional endoplasmic reticulum ATPase
MLLMFAPSAEDVHEDVRGMASGTRVIDIPLPTQDQRYAFILDKIDRDGWQLDMSPMGFAGLTSGLMLVHIEDIALRGDAANVPITADAVATLKAEIIKNECAGILEILQPKGGYSRVGGQTHFKTWAERNLIGPSGETDLRREMPLSFLLSGPPGTGKTTVAECTAAAMGWNCIEYKQVKDSLVGSTERNNAKAERIIRAMAPCVVFIDEIDQMGGKRVTGGAGGGGDAVEASLFRDRLKLMGDVSLRGDVLFIGASNRPDQIDDALTQRFEYRIPILPPESDEARADVLARLCARYGIYTSAGADAGGAAMERPIDTADMLPAARLMAEWSGRDMEGAINKARALIRLDSMPAIEAVEQAARTRRPLIRADARLMTQLAIADCNDIDLLPEQYRAEQATIDREELDSSIRERRASERRTLASRESTSWQWHQQWISKTPRC